MTDLRLNLGLRGFLGGTTDTGLHDLGQGDRMDRDELAGGDIKLHGGADARIGLERSTVLALGALQDDIAALAKLVHLLVGELHTVHGDILRSTVLVLVHALHRIHRHGEQAVGRTVQGHEILGLLLRTVGLLHFERDRTAGVGVRVTADTLALGAVPGVHLQEGLLRGLGVNLGTEEEKTVTRLLRGLDGVRLDFPELIVLLGRNGAEGILAGDVGSGTEHEIRHLLIGKLGSERGVLFNLGALDAGSGLEGLPVHLLKSGLHFVAENDGGFFFCHDAKCLRGYEMCV